MARSRRKDADIGGFDLSPENAAGDEFDASDDGGLISSAPVAELVDLVDLYGNAGNGLPLDQLFAGIDGEAASEAVAAMNAALATGDNPLSIVNQLAAILGVSQARAETIARTEMLGAWRDAQSINFRANSDVLDGWVWSSDLAGACIACVMMDGTVHTLDEDLESHPNCECCQIPLTKSWDDILGDLEGLDLSDLEETDYLNQGFEAGQDWFIAQPESYQIEVLGPAKFEAWGAGDVELLDFVGQKDAGAWGNEIYERSLKEIGLDANAYLRRTTVADVASAAEEATATEATAATVAADGVKVITTAYDGGDITSDIARTAADVFGRPVNLDELPALVGAPPGSTVWPGPSEFPDTLRFRLFGPGYDASQPFMEQWIAGKIDFMAERELMRQSDGSLIMHNISFKVRDDLQGSGIGIRVFASQVEGLQQAGVSKIITEAAGDAGSAATGGANGYYTWARFGYLGELPEEVLSTLVADAADGAVSAEWGNYTTVQELMTSPDGRAWWKANGTEWEGVFDLSDGSLSRQILSDYLRDKGMTDAADAIATGGA